jgi:hypothetical protein
MENKRTFTDIETLSKAKEKIEQLQEQYEEIEDVESRERHFQDIVRLEEKVEQAEKRMIKRIKKVVVLNEVEKARKEGIGKQIELFLDYLNLDDHFYTAQDKTTEFIDGAYNSYQSFILFYFMREIMAIGAAIISIPIALGILVAITGINLARLIPYINQNKKLKYELQASGLYDKIVAFLKEKKIDHFELGANSDDRVIGEFVQDEFGYGK